jgi:hypothetical protein
VGACALLLLLLLLLLWKASMQRLPSMLLLL